MPVVKPALNEHYVSGRREAKGSLAEAANHNAAQVRALLAQKHDLMVLLAAMIKHPDAVTQDAQGRVWLEASAIHALKPNTVLRHERAPDGSKVLLKVIESDYILRADPLLVNLVGQPLR